MKKVFVLGSINMDFSIRVDALPMVGESKRSHGYMASQGGKGANQAIANKKLGLDEVYFIGAVGNDENGRLLKEAISSQGVNVEGLKEDDKLQSGVCFAIFDEKISDNMLLIDPGANESVDPDFVESFLDQRADPGDIFIAQLEINLDAIYRGIKKAKELGMFVILNPAPVRPIDAKIYAYLDLIVLNETETKLLTGIDATGEESIKKAYQFFGVNEMVITLGKDGGYYINKEKIIKYDAYKAKVVDTTCAGDTFIGALSLKKANGKEIYDSLDFAAKCSAITVSRQGAGISIPTKEEVKQLDE